MPLPLVCFEVGEEMTEDVMQSRSLFNIKAAFNRIQTDIDPLQSISIGHLPPRQSSKIVFQDGSYFCQAPANLQVSVWTSMALIWLVILAFLKGGCLDTNALRNL